MAYPFVLIILILNRLVAGLHSASLLSLKPWTCLSKRVSSYKPSGKYSEPTSSYHSTTGLPFLLSYIHCKNALEREPKLEELPISLLTWMSRSNPDLRYNLSRLDILAYESPVGIWYLGIQCKSKYLIAWSKHTWRDLFIVIALIVWHWEEHSLNHIQMFIWSYLVLIIRKYG